MPGEVGAEGGAGGEGAAKAGAGFDGGNDMCAAEIDDAGGAVLGGHDVAAGKWIPFHVVEHHHDVADGFAGAGAPAFGLFFDFGVVHVINGVAHVFAAGEGEGHGFAIQRADEGHVEDDVIGVADELAGFLERGHGVEPAAVFGEEAVVVFLDAGAEQGANCVSATSGVAEAEFVVEGGDHGDA